MKLRSLFVLILACASPLFAQDKPNSMGFSFHHVSFVVPDYDANIDFWTKFGGKQEPMKAAVRFSLFHFMGSDVVVTVMENKANSGGSIGSVVDHIGFQVPDVPTAVERWKANGIRIEPGHVAQQAYVYTPDEVKIEILQDLKMTVPLKPHHIHFYTSDALATQAWYAKMFGAVPGKRGQFDDATIPNIDLTFSKADGAVAPTKGRALDHIGFAVRDMASTKKALEAKGVVFDPAMQPKGGTGPGNAQLAFFLDPWGTQIELIQPAPGQ